MPNSHLDGGDREFLRSDPRCGKTRLAGQYLQQAIAALNKVQELRPDIDVLIHNGAVVSRGKRLPLVFRMLNDKSRR